MISCMVSGFPSMRAEKSELLRVDFLLMFASTSFGSGTELIIWRLASIDWRCSVILGVSMYFGGISIFLIYYQILPNVARSCLMLQENLHLVLVELQFRYDQGGFI